MPASWAPADQPLPPLDDPFLPKPKSDTPVEDPFPSTRKGPKTKKGKRARRYPPQPPPDDDAVGEAPPITPSPPSPPLRPEPGFDFGTQPDFFSSKFPLIAKTATEELPQQAKENWMQAWGFEEPVPAAPPEIEAPRPRREVPPPEIAAPLLEIEADPEPVALPPTPPVPAKSPRPAPIQPAPSSISPPSRATGIYGRYSSSGGSTGAQRTNSFASAPSQQPYQQPQPQPQQQQQQRRESFIAPYASASAKPRFVEPPPPHMPQAHFYSLPDFGLDLNKPERSSDGKPAGSDHYCCTFDSFADGGDPASARKARDVLLVGSEGALDVYRVLPTKFEVVGHLEGLRGSVIGAKVLPHTELSDEDLAPLRPLVALVIHGPSTGSPAADGQPPNAYDDGRNEGIDGILGFYQTTVEVYSLRTQVHIATLYKSSLAPVEQPSIGHLTSLPGPVGDLSVAAKGRFVIVASGKSGEVFIFSAAPTLLHPESRFRCIGKVWTSLQMPLDSSRPSSGSDSGQDLSDGNTRPGLPLLSLSQRWLAVVSPSTSLNSSILGTPLLSEHSPAPVGVASHVAPPQPSVACDIAGVDAEGTWGRLTRQAAQGIVKYSHRGLEMGWQGWRELTNPAPQTQHQQHARASSKDFDQFPPTNAPPNDPRRFAREPAVVSVLDLDLLLEAEAIKPKYPPAPLATFALTEGCNYMSFSSNGLRMLAVSSKGEVSTVWDLAQACYGTTRRDASELQGPCVKQILRIPRSSQSVVIDSAWSREDDLLALLTTHGTVHLYEVPARAPPRKRKSPSSSLSGPAPDKAHATVSLSQGLSPPSSNAGFLGTIKSSWQQVSTGVTTMRSSSAATSFGLLPAVSFAGFKEATAHAGSLGSRLVARGLSQGYSAAKDGASDIWHADDNKIRHKGLATATEASDTTPVPLGRLRWIRSHSSVHFAVAAAGAVHLHSIVRQTRRKHDSPISYLKHEKGARRFALQPIRTRDDADNDPGTSVKRVDDCTAQGPHGYWMLRPLTAAIGDIRRASIPQLPSQNDVETNPPYCPFHVHSRVGIYAFDDIAAVLGASADSQAQLRRNNQYRQQRSPYSATTIDPSFHLHGHGYPVQNDSDDDESESPNWLFGGALPPSTKMNSRDERADGVGVAGYAESVDGDDIGEFSDPIPRRKHPSRPRYNDDHNVDNENEDEEGGNFHPAPPRHASTRKSLTSSARNSTRRPNPTWETDSDGSDGDSNSDDNYPVQSRRRLISSSRHDRDDDEIRVVTRVSSPTFSPNKTGK